MRDSTPSVLPASVRSAPDKSPRVKSNASHGENKANIIARFEIDEATPNRFIRGENGIYIAPGVQHINNPGNNRDRGPVIVPTFRAHVEF